MEGRVVTIILVCLVVVVGFFVIRSFIQGTDGVSVNVANTVECRLANAQCVPAGECQGETLTVACGEGTVCCRRPDSG